jgi:hypothetical protein
MGFNFKKEDLAAVFDYFEFLVSSHAIFRGIMHFADDWTCRSLAMPD